MTRRFAQARGAAAPGEPPPAAPPPSGLLDRRLLVVSGKGGVGKTTVACALALAAAGRGKRVLLCEIDGASRAAPLLGAEPVAVGEVREATPGVALMPVEGKAALEEYLQLVVPARRFLRTVFRSRIYRYFVAAAPGLKELMTIGKIWYEAERREENRPLWDLVIMDAPATGHGLQYLRMPAAAHQAFPAGLVHRESERLLGLLTDPDRCSVLLVTTAEEMPVNETIDMYRKLRDELRMPVGALLVNHLHEETFAERDLRRLDAAAEKARSPRERRIFAAAAARAREESGWTRVNRRHFDRLCSEVPLPALRIPHLFCERFGLTEVQTIAELTESQLSGAHPHRGMRA